MLVRIVKGWKGPDFFYQTPGEKGIWDGIRFTFDPVEECDLLIMLNNEMKTDVTVRCPRENVWAIMQEPYRRGHTDWMVEGHEAFSRVFTHHIPSGDPKYVRSHPADPWHVKKNFDELITATLPRKTGEISWIAGNATDLPGHMERFRFLDFVKRNDPIGIDYYGRAVRFIEDKWDGLAPYRYTIIVQNSVSPDYWTDVVEDTFLAGTVPLYCGCTNLEDYFPEEAFIRIDISRPEESLETIVKTVREVTDKPLSLDTTNVQAMEAGLKVHKGRAIINSISVARMDEELPLVLKYNADFIGLLWGREGLPRDANERGAITLIFGRCR